MDWTRHEELALERAEEMAGEFIESLPSTDMASWSADQFKTLIAVVVGAFSNRMAELADSDEAPF